MGRRLKNLFAIFKSCDARSKINPKRSLKFYCASQILKIVNKFLSRRPIFAKFLDSYEIYLIDENICKNCGSGVGHFGV